jgi:hypothetical protein
MTQRSLHPHRPTAHPGPALRRVAALLLVALAAAMFGPAPIARAATFVVTNTNDSGPGSLRDAMTQANNNPGADTITFNIPGAGVQTIAPITALPAITSPVLIDGATQPGASCASWPPTLLIELSGADLLPFGIGLVVAGSEASGSTIRGLVLNSFSNTGNGAGFSQAIGIVNSNDNAIECTFIGTDATGTLVVTSDGRFLSNNQNVIIEGTSANNRIGTNGDGANDAGERNLLNGDRAIILTDNTSGTTIAGNYVNTDVSGLTALGGGAEVVMLNDSGNNRIGTNGDGVSDTIERNIIVGFQAIFIPGSDNNVIAGNYINVDATGTVAFPNSQGIYVNGNNNIIGTDGSNDAFNANERNVIAGSTGNAALQVEGSANTVIAGNYIGTNAAGTAVLGNDFGVVVASGSSNTRIGTNGDGIADDLEGNIIAGGTNDGIQIAGSETSFTTVSGNFIGTDRSGTLDLGNDGNGISIVERPNPTTITGNLIRNNGGAGVLMVEAATGTSVRHNSIDANGAAGIISPEMPFPFLTRAVPSGSTLRVTGQLDAYYEAEDYALDNETFTLDFYSSPSCDPSFFGEGRTYLGSQQITTDATGNAEFDLAFTPVVAVPLGALVTATATGPSIYGSGATSAFSNCSSAGPGNDAWPRAFQLSSGADFTQPIDLPGQTRWFTIPAPPASRVAVTLSGPGGAPLPAGYDLAVFKDIDQAFTTLTTPQDLTRLTAEFAGDGFSNDTLAPDALNPVRIAPQAYSPQAYSPQAYSPQAYSPQAYSPQAYSPQAYSPQAYSPQAYSPQAYSPQAYSPQAYSPQAYSPEQLAYANAQSRSLLGVAALEGTAPRTLDVNTWNNAGEIYIQVRGQNGAFTPLVPFEIQATVLDGVCQNVQIINGQDAGISGSYRTIILADLSRVAGEPNEISALQAKLATLAQRENGVIIDTGSATFPVVQAARAQVAANQACPFAKNQLAEKIKALYRNVQSIEYIVVVGPDDAVPFFRTPDNAPLGPESNYEPPLLDSSPSQAALRLNYILGQDAYGATTSVSFGNDTLPVPHIPVGRLVETASQINTLLDAYLALPNGVAPTPTSALVTSYDFLVDTGDEVQSQLSAGLLPGATVARLDSPASESFLDPAAWTGDELRAALFGPRRDLIFLAGHFSSGSTLAADFRTTVEAAEVTTAATDFTNVLVWSVGCHSGYNLEDSAAVPGVTRSLDWASAFASRGATLIGGTGYQYGDTDFLAYSEKIYAEFTRQLRVGTGPVAIGDALVAAKQAYLASTPNLEGIDDKSLRIATIYGLPMLKINMPGQRIPIDTGGSSSIAPITVPSGPGSNPLVNLRVADTSVPISLSPLRTKTLTNIDNPSQTVEATYYEGPSGLVIRPVEPVLPFARVNVGVPGVTLRGVGFRGGSYQDEQNVRPLVSAPTYDLRGVKVNFAPPVFWPVKPFAANYFGVLADPQNGTTELQLTPVQFRTATPTDQTGTRRVWSRMDFRLFYSSVFAPFPSGSAPALSDGPAIAKVASAAVGSTVVFTASVTGDPAAGVQGVWVTWTDPTVANPQWQSLDLSQSANDSTRWSGTLTGVNPANVRFIVQAVSALGVVTLVDNFGAFFRPGVDPAAPPTTSQQATSLALENPPANGSFSTQVTLMARLTAGGTPQSGQAVILSLGGQTKPTTTDTNGRASATFTLTSAPGGYQAGASFGGTDTLRASAASTSFTILKRDTRLTLTPVAANVPAGANTGIIATLTDIGGAPLALRTVFFTIGSLVVAVPTNALGQAGLGALNLPPGSYSVNIGFGGNPAPGVTQTDPNYNSSSASGSLTLTGATGTAPQITSTPVTSATQGQPYSYQVTASGSPAPTFSLTTAPTGMTINSTSGLITWTPAVLPGAYPVTVQAENGAGSPATQSFSVQVVVPTTRQPVSPVLECVVDRGSGWSNPATRYVARWGYQNRNTFQVEIPVNSSTNKFTPTPFNRGQPTVFLPGRVRNTFEVAFNGNNLVWHLSGRTATASSNPVQRCQP